MTDFKGAPAAPTTPPEPTPALPVGGAVPGLAFRLYAGETDLAELVRVWTAAREADGLKATLTVEDLALDFANPVNFDPSRDVLIAAVGGRMVAYGRVEWVDTNDGARSYDSRCMLEPVWRRRGIGRSMLRWNEARLREIAATHPTDRPRRFGTYHWDRDTAAAEVYAAEGYRPVRHFYDMLRPTLDDIPEAPLPAGLEIRPVRPQHVRAVWDADVEAFRDHWGGFEDSPEAYRQFTEGRTFDPSIWKVAWDGDRIAGLVMNVIDPHENELRGYRRGLLDSVAVRRPWRRRGLARSLIVASLRELRERGMTSAALGVDAQNPLGALQLYASVGFEVELSATAYEKPLE
ncbi:MAG: GNAT family N-acetyltransferase [Candidatus Limnocylindrales bacterium]